jgi:hypothetical protein
MFKRQCFCQVPRSKLIFDSRNANASQPQLERCAKAPSSEFHGAQLAWDRVLTWESVFSPYALDSSSVAIPLALSACEVRFS